MYCNQPSNSVTGNTEINQPESNEQIENVPESISNNINANPTGAYQDDSVIQSDLKNIRQSAVKMSVGQKQGASQIVKDWLDDGGDATDDSTQDETEE